MSGTILLVDDNEFDTELALLALDCLGAAESTLPVSGGEEALRYLDAQVSAGLPLPALMLLDLKMPRMDGHEVLRAVQRRPEFGQIPVVVFSGSGEPQDVRRSLELGAKAHFVKPVTLDRLEQQLRHICDSWLRINGSQSPARAVPA